MVQSEYNLKNIQRTPKKNLNKIFVRNLNIISKGLKEIWRMPHPIKGPVTSFNLTNIFVKNPWHVFSTKEVTLADAISLPETCDNFWVVAFGV